VSTSQQKIAAVVLAAGKGTRMKSEMAKVLHRACGRPLAFFSIRAAFSVECAPVVAVVGHQAEEVERQSGELFPSLKFALQKQQLGTGHAVLSAEEALRGFSGSVLILAADVPLVRPETLRQLIEAKQRSGAQISFLTWRAKDPTGYGRIVRNSKGEVARIVEEKDASPEEKKIDEVNASIYLCDSEFLFRALRSVGRSNAQGEYYLTDVIAQGRAVAVEAEEAEVSGVNDRAQLARSAAKIRESKNAQLMKDGVTLVDPAVSYIDEGVEIGPDSMLEPLVSLRGKTRVGRGVEIGQGCVIVDSEIADGARILP
jgi:bifunctional UDP-N-acetylglucosamine pyrophosphorylase/glucosamine-1-phosphate N-acetyltransferase